MKKVYCINDLDEYGYDYRVEVNSIGFHVSFCLLWKIMGMCESTLVKTC